MYAIVSRATCKVVTMQQVIPAYGLNGVANTGTLKTNEYQMPVLVTTLSEAKEIVNKLNKHYGVDTFTYNKAEIVLLD